MNSDSNDDRQDAKIVNPRSPLDPDPGPLDPVNSEEYSDVLDDEFPEDRINDPAAGGIRNESAKQEELKQKDNRGQVRALWVSLFAVSILLAIITTVALRISLERPMVVAVQSGEAPASIPAGTALNSAEIYERISPGVVTLRSVATTESPDQMGSGVVIDNEGHIITNLHVVSSHEQDNLLTANEVFIEFLNGDRASASVLGYDANSDIALLKIRDTEGLDLTPVVFGDSDATAVGDAVMAIGSPFGRPGSMSVGVISGRDRVIGSLIGPYGIPGVLQTDAAVNKGNSGGPLINARGELVGINSQIDTDSQRNEGVAYAVPSNAVLRIIPRMKTEGAVVYPHLGVSTRTVTPQMADVLGLPVEEGALVQVVVAESPAAVGGVRGPTASETFFGDQIGVGGDIIIEMNGEKIQSADDLVSFIISQHPTSDVEMVVVRPGGEEQRYDVKLMPRTEY